MTYPHIGNYGINPEDCESNKIQVAGLIVREESVIPSNFRATKSLGDYLFEEKIVGIQEIDTRMLTRIIRDEGAMNGIISSVDLNETTLLNKVKIAPSMNGLDLAKIVSTKKKYLWENRKKKETQNNGTDPPSPTSHLYRIAAIDFGIKHNILRQLETNGCDIMVFPGDTTADEIMLDAKINGCDTVEMRSWRGGISTIVLSFFLLSIFPQIFLFRTHNLC
jgi:carbamoyl-phosphate synthase small subunit